MPKASNSPPIPLNGLFPIAKPSGPPSMKVIDAITPLLLDSNLFHDPEKLQPHNSRKKKKNLTHMGLKIGQGGTLDPLADGVLVIGVNRGTKHLNRFLECSKEYESIGLLGASTTTYDSEGPILATAPFDGITREDVEKVLDRFRGKITQTPPIFSALKMDGKPLYEYARESLPLPRPIPVRPCEVSIELVDFKPASVTPGDGGHEYRWPTQLLSVEEKGVFRKLTDIVHKASEAEHQPTSDPAVPDLERPDVPEISEKTGLRPATFTVRMTVSSGTYVRSIVHDIGLALGCAAHVVKLTRTRQGEFTLYGDEQVLAAADNEAAAQALAQGADPAAPAAVQPEDPEEAAMNASAEASSSAAAGQQSSESLQPPPSGPSTGCIPWSVLEEALEDRKAMLAAEQVERENAEASGMSADELKQQFSRDALLARRRARPLQAWENEVLRRFHSVPIPLSGGKSGDYKRY